MSPRTRGTPPTTPHEWRHRPSRRRRDLHGRRRDQRRRLLLVAGLVLVAALIVAVAAAARARNHVKPHVRSTQSIVLTRAKIQDPTDYRFVRRHHAQLKLWAHGKAFTVSSPGAERGAPVIVTLHGYKSSAFEQYREWQPYAASHGWGLIALQWRTGFDTRAKSLSGGAIYWIAAQALRAMHVRPGHALLHGFSSAAFRTYGVTALDRRRRKLFAVTIANSGAPNKGYPTAGLVTGRNPYAGTHWVLFCGGKDPYPDFTGCPAMRRGRAYVRQRGGTVSQFVDEPKSGHGGFIQHPEDVRAALALFARVMRANG